tara:strand:+ start:652 stop:1839 length:1188 start_codon:yes stop_codon:yes gene_type:complete
MLLDDNFKQFYNVKTKKFLKTNGKLCKKILKNYNEPTIYNPLTKNIIQTNSSTGRKILKIYKGGGNSTCTKVEMCAQDDCISYIDFILKITNRILNNKYSFFFKVLRSVYQNDIKINKLLKQNTNDLYTCNTTELDTITCQLYKILTDKVNSILSDSSCSDKIKNNNLQIRIHKENLKEFHQQNITKYEKYEKYIKTYIKLFLTSSCYLYDKNIDFFTIFENDNNITEIAENTPDISINNFCNEKVKFINILLFFIFKQQSYLDTHFFDIFILSYFSLFFSIIESTNNNCLHLNDTSNDYHAISYKKNGETQNTKLFEIRLINNQNRNENIQNKYNELESAYKTKIKEKTHFLHEELQSYLTNYSEDDLTKKPLKTIFILYLNTLKNMFFIDICQ